MSSFTTTDLGSQASTKRLLADSVISPVFYQPSLYLGTFAVPFTVSTIGPFPSINYQVGINRYVYYCSYTSAGLGTSVGVPCYITNCPVNLLSTTTADNMVNFYSVPAAVDIAIQTIFDPFQFSAIQVGSNLGLVDNHAGIFKYKIVITLTPESG